MNTLKNLLFGLVRAVLVWAAFITICFILINTYEFIVKYIEDKEIEMHKKARGYFVLSNKKIVDCELELKDSMYNLIRCKGGSDMYNVSNFRKAQEWEVHE